MAASNQSGLLGGAWNGLLGTLGDIGIGAASGLSHGLATPLGLLSHPGFVPRYLLAPFSPQTADAVANVTDGLTQFGLPALANAADATQRASTIQPQTAAGRTAEGLVDQLGLSNPDVTYFLNQAQKYYVGQRPAPNPPWINFGN